MMRFLRQMDMLVVRTSGGGHLNECRPSRCRCQHRVVLLLLLAVVAHSRIMLRCTAAAAAVVLMCNMCGEWFVGRWHEIMGLLITGCAQLEHGRSYETVVLHV